MSGIGPVSHRSNTVSALRRKPLEPARLTAGNGHPGGLREDSRRSHGASMGPTIGRTGRPPPDFFPLDSNPRKFQSSGQAGPEASAEPILAWFQQFPQAQTLNFLSSVRVSHRKQDNFHADD